MNNHLVSIIIPTFNRAHLISETLNSVLAQTYANWECIVVDDGSTDDTENLLKAYCKKESRIKYYIRPDSLPKGGNVCRNFGFEMSNGTYIKWLDSDDLLSKEVISAQLETLLKGDSIMNISTAKFNFFKDSVESITPLIKQINKNYKIGYDLLFDFGVFKAFLPPHSYLVHKAILLKSGLWNERLLINQDGEFFARVLLNSNNVIHANEGMVYYRFDYENDTVSKISNRDKAKDAILSWILIDSYIKVYTKKNETIQYVTNAKASLLNVIEDKEITNQFKFFLKPNKLVFNVKRRLFFFINMLRFFKRKVK